MSWKENYCVWRCTDFFRIFPRKYFGWGDCELKFATSKKYPLRMSLVSIDFVEVVGDSNIGPNLILILPQVQSNKWKCDLLHGAICVMKSQILIFADLTKAKLCELLSWKENYCVWRCTNFFRIFPRKYFGWGDCELKFATSKKYPLRMSLVSIDFVEVVGDSLELLLSWITAFELWFSRVRIEFSSVNLPSSILNYCRMVHISMFTF